MEVDGLPPLKQDKQGILPWIGDKVIVPDWSTSQQFHAKVVSTHILSLQDNSRLNILTPVSLF